MPITKAIDLIKAGVPVMVDTTMLRVTTIKKKFVDQMLTMGYSEFCNAKKGTDPGCLAIVGRVGTAKIIVTMNNMFFTVTSRDFIEWRGFTYMSEPPNDVYKKANADFIAIPQIFED